VRFAFDRQLGFFDCGASTPGLPERRDAGLVPGDLRQRPAQCRGVVVADRRDHRNHVARASWSRRTDRRSRPPTTARSICVAREVHKGKRGPHLKGGRLPEHRRQCLDSLTDGRGQPEDCFNADGLSVDARALTPVDQVGEVYRPVRNPCACKQARASPRCCLCPLVPATSSDGKDRSG